MPPKQRITREMILETSFVMFCREGMETVNARSVAKALNCSTQPIFSYFEGMDDLKGALENKACEMFDAAISEAIASDKPLFNSCMAYFRFAMNQPNLFRQLFLLKREKRPESLAAINDALLQKAVQPIAEKNGGDVAAVEQRCIRFWVYTHGMAALAAMGLLDMNEETVEAMLRDAEAGLGLN